ncbi:MAG: TetR/AcrR family transcriptional regulator [Deltaproteobacteria bacterium]|nr:TetR/AcrR family transcriptional regulator [Deltaproteobacteria bacterium]
MSEDAKARQRSRSEAPRRPAATGRGRVASPEAGGPGAGRPRSEEAHRAILDATLALLAEQGYSALTVEGVASRAGVGKATIYRRWPSKLPLVIEAFGGLPAFEEVDTGDLQADLTEMLRRYLERFNATPLATVLPSLVGERLHNPELAEVIDPLLRHRRQPLRHVFERAVARGEIAPDVDLDLAADLVVGPIGVRLFFTGRRVGPKMAGPMVALALRGIAPALFAERTPVRRAAE